MPSTYSLISWGTFSVFFGKWGHFRGHDADISIQKPDLKSDLEGRGYSAPTVLTSVFETDRGYSHPTVSTAVSEAGRGYNPPYFCLYAFEVDLAKGLSKRYICSK